MSITGAEEEEEPSFQDMKTPEETVSVLEALDSSSSCYKEYKDTLSSIDPMPPTTGMAPIHPFFFYR